MTILPQPEGASARTNYALSGGAELLTALEVDFVDGLAAGMRSNATACLAGPLAEEMFLAGQRSRANLNDIRRAA